MRERDDDTMSSFFSTVENSIHDCFLNDELLNNWWSITSTQIWTETMETNGINNMLQLEQRGIKEEKKISCAFSDDSFHTSNMFYVQTQLGLGENTGKL